MTGRKNLSLRFNCEIINSDHFEDFLAEIIPHEVAHLCGFVDPRLGRKHDAAWRRTCIALGGNGARTHSYDVVVRGRWDYVTDPGHKVSVSKRHHLAVQAGLTLRFKRGLGMITKLSQHAPSGQLRVTPKAGGTTVVRTQPKQASAPAPKTIINTTPTASNWAQRARQLIQLHKPQGVSMEMVMAMAIEAGMPRERARTCVKGFWEKV